MMVIKLGLSPISLTKAYSRYTDILHQVRIYFYSIILYGSNDLLTNYFLYFAVLLETAL